MLPQFAIAGHGSEPGRGSRGAEAGGRGAEEQQPPPAGRPPMPGRRRRGAQGGPGARSCLLWLFVLLKVSAGKGRGRPPHAPHHPSPGRLCVLGGSAEAGARPRSSPLCAPEGGWGGRGSAGGAAPRCAPRRTNNPPSRAPEGEPPNPSGCLKPSPPTPESRRPPSSPVRPELSFSTVGPPRSQPGAAGAPLGLLGAAAASPPGEIP